MTSPITITEKIQPFSHLPGTKFPIPFSDKGLQVFPAALILYPENQLIPLNIKGPVKNFTSMLDLEKGTVKVFGEAVSGYFRYYIFTVDGKICFFQDRGEALLPEGTSLAKVNQLPSSKKFEKFSLGSNKSQDWELVKRRENLEEILPVWYRLGQMFKCPYGHSSSLLKELTQESSFLNLFNAGFSGIFHPESFDSNYLGFALPPVGQGQNPLSSLVEGFNKIRSLLILEKDSTCQVLPEILSFFPHGKITGLQTSFGEVDVEWTKNRMRQMVVRCTKQSHVQFSFPKTHKRCRLQASDLHLNLTLNCSLDLRANTHYFLSHFQE